jgi:integrase
MKTTLPQEPKRGRPRTGRIESWTDSAGIVRYRARITLQDGTLKRTPIPGIKTKAQAKALALRWQREEQATNLQYENKLIAAGLPVGTETTSEWFVRYCISRESTVTTVSKDRQRWAKYIHAFVGNVQIIALERKHAEDISRSLDTHVAKNLITSKTAAGIWAIFTCAMKEVCSSRDPGLRVREANPCLNVKPPVKKDDSKNRTFFYPVEVTKLLACDAVPLHFRQLYAIALYTYFRPGEIASLTWASVAFETQSISVSDTRDWTTGKNKAPKTRKGRRTIRIKEHLLPLLQAMKGLPAEQVWPAFEQWDADMGGVTVRSHLVLAGVTRAALHEGTRESVRADLRTFRTTGVTFEAMLGTDAKTIERRTGHASGVSTDVYIRAAEDVGLGEIGVPFGPLPEALISATLLATKSLKPQNSAYKHGCRRRDLNPRPSAYETPAHTD